LPRRAELLEGLIGADYIAFHTHAYLQHFRSSLLRILGIASKMDHIDLGPRLVRLDALPIGVAAQELTESLRSGEIRERVAEMRKKFAGCKVIISVDRLITRRGYPNGCAHTDIFSSDGRSFEPKWCWCRSPYPRVSESPCIASCEEKSTNWWER
jgi:trehalose-6-phosphate synthase